MVENLKKYKSKIARAIGILVALFFTSFLLEYFFFDQYFNQYRFLFILSIGSLALIFYALRKKIGERPELGFLAVALICGSLLSVSEPKTYVSWDEKTHYQNSEKLAANVVPNMRFRGLTIPSSYSLEEQKKINAYVDESKYKKPLVKSSARKLKYDKIAYVPSSAALAVGNWVHLPGHIIYIFGRWINVLLYSLIVFLAIRKLKSGKMIMSVVALFPTAIFLSSNYNYDSWITAFTMLGLAYLFSELQQPDKKVSWREIIIMNGAFVIGLAPKAIYFPLMFLLFFLKPKKFSSSRQYKQFLLATAASILFVAGTFMLPFLIKGPGDGDQRGGSMVNATEQVKFILAEPLVYAKILVKFALEYVNPMNAEGFITSFAYIGTMKKYLFFIILAMLAFVVFTDKNAHDKTGANWKIGLGTFSVYFATVFLISTALYISFTAVRSLEFAGVQPRYLIPLVFPILYVLGGSLFKNPWNKNFYNLAVFAVLAGVLLKGIWDLIIRNYYL